MTDLTKSCLYTFPCFKFIVEDQFFIKTGAYDNYFTKLNNFVAGQTITTKYSRKVKIELTD